MEKGWRRDGEETDKRQRKQQKKDSERQINCNQTGRKRDLLLEHDY